MFDLPTEADPSFIALNSLSSGKVFINALSVKLAGEGVNP